MDESSLPVTLRLAQAAADAQHRERARLSKTLHDSIGGALSAVAVELDLLSMDFADTPEFKTRLSAIVQTLEKAFDHVRALTYDVTPNLVDRIGLEAALYHLAARTGARINVVDGASAFTGPQADACHQIAELAMEEALRTGAGNLSLDLADGHLEIRHDTTPVPADDPGLLLAAVRMKLAALNTGLFLAIVPDPSARGTITQVSVAMKGRGHVL